jgi:AAA domain
MSTKDNLISIAKALGINDTKGKTKDQLKELIREFKIKNNILQEGKVIKRIYHTADIHIRVLDRHQEYQHVFENLYKKLQEDENLNEAVLLICGDIFHSRERLVSETIILFNKFIEKLTSLIDTVLILGNHDIYLSNDRLDILSGILSLKEISNFYFLKESGIYKYNNINFYVSSLYDKKFLRCPKLDNEEKKEINVSLYHGGIFGCKLDNNYEYIGDSVKLQDFKYFDYVLLGDIHKRQFLKENIAYPGSLIQQSHKEDEIHGILKWDLTNKKCDFIQIENEYSYKTINFNSPLVDFNLSNIKFTKFTNIRFQHNYFEEFDLHKIKEEISKYTEIVSFVKEIIESDTVSSDLINEQENGQGNCEPIKKDNSLKLITNDMNIPEEIQHEIMKLHQNEMNEIQIDNKKTNNMWYIKSLEFKNVFIYGNDYLNKITFKNGITGILGTNGIGKSAIFNIILYSLFGNIFKSKSYTNRNIINKNAKTYYIKMVITTDNGTEYIIERKGKNKKRSTGDLKSTRVEFNSKLNSFNFSMEETLSFFCNGKELTESKVSTSNIICEKLNLTTKDAFILTNILSYTNYISLLNMTSSDLSNKFNELFNLDIYTDIYSSTLKKTKKITDEIKKCEEKITELNKNIKKETIVETKLHECHNEIILIKDELQQTNQLLDDIIQNEISLGNLNVKFGGNVYTQDDLNTLIKSKDNILLKINKNKYELQELKKQITLEQVNVNEIHEVSNLSIYELQDKIKKLELQIIPCNIVSKSVYNKIIEKERYEPTIFIEELNSLKGKKLPDDLHMDLLEFLNEINSKEYLSDAINILDYKHTLSNNTIRKQINTLKCKLLYQINKHIEQLQLDEKISEVQNYLKFADDLKKKQEFLNKKNELKVKQKKLNNELLNITSNTTRYEVELKKISEDKITIENIKENIVKLTSYEKIHKLYKDIIKQFPKRILTDTIKLIEHEANKMIYKLINYYIVFNESESTYEILIKKGNMILGVEHLSGYERFIVNVILKITLDKYKYYDKANIFIIDEVLDATSNENIKNKIPDLFEILKREYPIVLITSHNDYLKDTIDQKINITSDLQCSKIE